jgi:hypothetical protein
LARKAIYKHATQVDTATYPDDGSSPVGSNEWNEAPDAQGMLGFSPQTATITISSGALTITDTITVAAAETGTTDTIDTIAITNTNEYDLLYLFADTGDTITLTNTTSPSVSGQIRTISNANETLSTTVPTILIRKGNYWYGYGGGVVNAIGDVGDVTITSVADNEVLAYDNGTSEWINQTASEAGLVSNTLTSANIIVGNGSNVATGVAVSGDASITNAGVISVSDLTITSEAQGDVLYFNGSNWVRLAAGTSGHFLKTQGTGANPVWAAAGGGDEANPVLQANGYTPTYTSPSTEGTDKVSIWVETIDSNNQGVYAKIKKNGSYVTVQIA